MKYIGTVGNRSLSDDDSYVAACEQATLNQEAYQNFKRDPRYTRILEHVTPELGSEYCDVIQRQTPELIQQFENFKRRSRNFSWKLCFNLGW